MSTRRASCDSLPTTGFAHHGGGNGGTPSSRAKAGRRLGRDAPLNRARASACAGTRRWRRGSAPEPAALGQLSGEQRRAIFRRRPRRRPAAPASSSSSSRGSASTTSRSGPGEAHTEARGRRERAGRDLADRSTRIALTERQSRLPGFMPGAAEVTADVRERIAVELEAARARTTALLEPFSDEQLTRAGVPAHVPARVGPRAHRPLRGAVDQPAARRRAADPPGRGRHVRRVRPRAGGAAVARAARPACRSLVPRRRARRSLEVLDEIELDADDPLLRGGFAFGLVVQHEQQHVETMLQTIQLSGWEHPGGSPGRDHRQAWATSRSRRGRS